MDFVTLASVLVGIGIGLVLGWMRGKQQLAGAVSRREYDTVVQENAVLDSKLAAASEEALTLRRELTEYRERAIAAETIIKTLEERLQLQIKQMAAAMFEEYGTKFSTHSEKKIGELLNPVRERLVEFQKLVGDSFTAQRTEQNSLKDEIGKIVLQADSLTKALRGDVKAQGNWGEVMLERILEESALRRDADYFVQAAEMGLVGEEGNRLRPDVIIKIPGDKHIIIDSKVSLTAYERYCGDDSDRETHLKEFLRSVKNHVNGLEQKRYQDIEKLGAPDFVLMFMPIEGAFSLAVQRDPELHSYAWGKKIVIVCPSTLFATLQTVASLWRIERQNQNAQEIARQGSTLYDKFVGFVEDMQTIGSQLTRAQKSYDDAMNKLSDGKGNLVSRAENLRALGVKTSKTLPIKSDDADLEEPLKLLAEG